MTITERAPHLICTFVAAAFFLIVVGCRAAPTEDRVAIVLNELEKDLVPAEAKNIQRSGFIRTSYTVKASWNFEVNEDWASYSADVKKQLQFTFELQKETDTQLIFSERIGNDTHMLTIRGTHGTQGEHSLNVYAENLIYPD